MISLSEAEKQKLITELEQFNGKFDYYRRLVLTQKGWETERKTLPNKQLREIQKLKVELQRKYGSLKEVIERYGGSTKVLLERGNYECEAFIAAFSYAGLSLEALTRVMDTAVAAINIAIGNLQTTTLAESPATAKTSVPPKAFIAHGGEPTACRKLCEFLGAMKVLFVIAEKEPSEGRSVNEHVDWCLDQSDCAIILATKGDIDGKTGNWIPRGNILVEIGKAQERFPKKTVYLLEEGATFPTDISEKVWERFTCECMDGAFIKVAKELTAFGLIKAVKSQ